MKAGGLCFGVGGLEMGLARVLDVELAWYAEVDEHAARVAGHNWPGVPNVGDITTADWAAVEPVDVLTAGYPCQPFSHAGKRKGSADERHLWPYVADAVRVLRPRLVVLENVAGHVSLGLDTVLWDLAALGFDAEWAVVRAADAGACHGRARVFIAAAQNPDRATGGERRLAAPGQAEGWRARPDARRRGRASAPHAPGDAGRVGDGDGGPAADPPGDGRVEGRTEPAGLVGGPDAAERRASPAADATGARSARCEDAGASRGDAGARSGRQEPERDSGERVEWGVYEPAIRRWEAVLGRPAPRPTEPGRNGRERLSPPFVEWMQGLPAGHVTAVPGIPRNAQLKALGNGVVPQQAELALRLLLPRLFTGEVAAAS